MDQVHVSTPKGTSAEKNSNDRSYLEVAHKVMARPGPGLTTREAKRYCLSKNSIQDVVPILHRVEEEKFGIVKRVKRLVYSYHLLQRLYLDQ